jgi:hypothetical protein
MKRPLFFVLMMTCSISWADWRYAGKTEKFAVYVDKSTIRKNGDIVSMWTLRDYFEVQTLFGLHKSLILPHAFNCRERTAALTAQSYHTDSMGKGDVFFIKEWKDSEWNFRPFPPGSIVETTWKIACSKK